MVVFPNAKINIGLQVLSKRDDGYHDICSLLYPIGLADALEAIPGPDKSLTKFTSSGIDIPGSADSNICLKAIELIRKEYPVPPLQIHLHKHIPVGAGLGGGSSDGASMITLLNKRFELGLSWGEMHHYARQLGSDCSFFVNNRPALVTGRGDEIESLAFNLSGYSLVLVYPPIHISTKDAYSMVIPEKSGFDLEGFLISNTPETWEGKVRNDFELPVLKRYPEIAAIKNKLYAKGGLYVSMSGSGSSVFGLFKQAPCLKKEFPDCFVWEETFI
ncbi:MAG: 4-(cytidine 5'-diphospho)-2-C-methyl-D-erythritol kinase [Bacteroidia bacterium]